MKIAWNQIFTQGRFSVCFVTVVFYKIGETVQKSNVYIFIIIFSIITKL